MSRWILAMLSGSGAATVAAAGFSRRRRASATAYRSVSSSSCCLSDATRAGIFRGLRRVEGLRFGVDAALQGAQLVERGRGSVRARTGSALHQQLQQTARPAALAGFEGLRRMAAVGIGRMLRHEHAYQRPVRHLARCQHSGSD